MSGRFLFVRLEFHSFIIETGIFAAVFALDM
jgi:hypothetical protein